MPALDTISPKHLTPPVEQVVAAAPIPGLDAAPKCPATARAIETLVNGDTAPPPLVVAGLWLLAGELDRSHEISQSQESAEGAFWHGIMHRREGDFWNSKYWFRQVGKHAVHSRLAEQVAAQQASFQASGLPLDGLTDARRLPSQLVDLCEKAINGQTEWTGDLQRICWWEWQFLLESSLATH